MRLLVPCLVGLAAAVAVGEPAGGGRNAPAAGLRLFTENCASCHGPDRMGLLAPPLMQQTLTRFTDDQLRDILRRGIAGTRMASFALALDEPKMNEIIAFIRQPGEPTWSDADVERSQRLVPPDGDALALADTGDLTAVVERGTGNVLFIQDHELVREVFFPNVHGGLKYVGERLFIPARTGFLERLDLHALQPEITARAGIYLRNIEVSPEYVIAACLLPPTLVFFDHDLNRRKTLPLDGDPSAACR